MADPDQVVTDLLEAAFVWEGSETLAASDTPILHGVVAVRMLLSPILAVFVVCAPCKDAKPVKTEAGYLISYRHTQQRSHLSRES